MVPHITKGESMRHTSYSTQRLRNNKGFTLIELLIVIAIIALLASVLVPKLAGRTDDARRVTAQAEIHQIESALELYRLDNGRLPTTEQGLQALVTKPTAAPEAKSYRDGGYIKRLPVDPWKLPYTYIIPGKRGEFDLFSYGADGVEGGEKNNADIGNW